MALDPTLLQLFSSGELTYRQLGELLTSMQPALVLDHNDTSASQKTPSKAEIHVEIVARKKPVKEVYQVFSQPFRLQH